MSKKKIAFVVSHLSLGGAQRVITTLSNILIDKYDITIISTVSKRPFYTLDERIKVLPCFMDEEITMKGSFLGSFKLNFKITRRVTLLLKKEKIDLVIGFITKTNVYSIIAAKYNKIPSIISERTNPVNDKIPLFWKRLRKLVYPHADYVVVQTENAKNHYSEVIIPEKLVILPNPISPELAAKKEAINRDNVILNVGRLHWVKNQKLIIEAFASLNPKDWQLLIIGEGAERQNLECAIKKTGNRNIHLLGSKENVANYYNKAKIFTFTSIFEGFPNALIEAMHFGMACVSTNCPSGPSELIEHGNNGFLISLNDVDKLKHYLGRLVNEPKLQKKMGIMAEESTQKYEAKKVAILWENLIEKCFEQ